MSCTGLNTAANMLLTVTLVTKAYMALTKLWLDFTWTSISRREMQLNFSPKFKPCCIIAVKSCSKLNQIFGIVRKYEHDGGGGGGGGGQ